jgi:hypothetical protein
LALTAVRKFVDPSSPDQSGERTQFTGCHPLHVLLLHLHEAVSASCKFTGANYFNDLSALLRDSQLPSRPSSSTTPSTGSSRFVSDLDEAKNSENERINQT